MYYQFICRYVIEHLNSVRQFLMDIISSAALIDTVKSDALRDVTRTDITDIM